MTDSVGPTPHFRSVAHINAFGYVMLVALALIFLPLLPFIAVFWLLGQRSGAEPA
jgi:hypothetical protein